MPHVPPLQTGQAWTLLRLRRVRQGAWALARPVRMVESEEEMTDNRTTELTATEQLRALLDERGIEWKDGDASYEIEWSTPDGRHCSAMYWKPTFTVLVSGCTPEQAIAATLGSGTCERVKVGTKPDGTPRYRCSVCNYGIGDTRWAHCPKCGSRIIEVVER